jgi:hypothetical protein
MQPEENRSQGRYSDIEALERRAKAAERLAQAAERRAAAAERLATAERRSAPRVRQVAPAIRPVRTTHQTRHPVLNSDFPGVPTAAALLVIFAAIWPWMEWSRSGHEVGWLILSIAWSIFVGIPIGIWAIAKVSGKDK